MQILLDKMLVNIHVSLLYRSLHRVIACREKSWNQNLIRGLCVSFSFPDEFKKKFTPRTYASTNASVSVKFEGDGGKIFVRPVFDGPNPGFHVEGNRVKGCVKLSLGGRWATAKPDVRC